MPQPARYSVQNYGCTGSLRFHFEAQFRIKLQFYLGGVVAINKISVFNEVKPLNAILYWTDINFCVWFVAINSATQVIIK